MKRLAWLLILLLVSAPFDGAWAVASDSPSLSVDDDNDEYLPAQRRSRGEQGTFNQKPAPGRFELQTSDHSFVRRDGPSEWNLITPFAPPPLYVFMSLQI